MPQSFVGHFEIIARQLKRGYPGLNFEVTASDDGWWIRQAVFAYHQPYAVLSANDPWWLEDA